MCGKEEGAVSEFRKACAESPAGSSFLGRAKRSPENRKPGKIVEKLLKTRFFDEKNQTVPPPDIYWGLVLVDFQIHFFMFFIPLPHKTQAKGTLFNPYGDRYKPVRDDPK